MKKTTNWLLLFLLSCAWSTSSMGQGSKSVSGTVRDSLGNGLPGITFTVRGTKTGGATDNLGNFNVNVPASNAVLVFSGVGYETQEVAINDNGQLSVVLHANANSLNEVIVTGFGARMNTRKLSYAVTEVKGSDLTKANNSNFVDALQGKVAGVMVTQGTGGPSSSARIRIRGNSRLDGNTQPLVVIDGILIEPTTTGSDSWGDGQDFGNVIKDLNPDDYESVTVLKGSAASALYGSKAQNGVLLITTKKGHARKGIGVSVTHSESYEKAYKTPDFQNEFGGGVKPTFDKDADGNDVVDISAGPYNNPDGGYSFGPKFDGHMVKDLDGVMRPWVPNDPLGFFQVGKYINTNVSAEGGTENTTFRFSYSNLYNTSIMPNNTLNRNSFTLRATQRLSKKIMLDASINYTNGKVHNPIIQGGNDNPLFAFSYYMARNAPIEDFRHNYIDPVAGGVKHNANGDNSDPYYLSHVLWNYYENNKNQNENNLLANLDLTVDITPWLNLLVRTNVNQFNSTYEEKNNGKAAGFADQYYRLDKGDYKNTRVQGLLNLNKNLGKDFELHASAGAETYRNLGGALTSQNTNGGLQVPGFYTISNSLNQVTSSVKYDGQYATKRLDAVYLYGDLTWKEMLTLNFSVRHDWSSSLTYRDGHGDYEYTYPSVGLAWVFTELPSFRNSNSVLSFGKLRASLGYTGFDAAPYSTNSAGNYALTGSPFNAPGNNNQSIYTFNGSVLGNPSLKNELAREIELGADLRFFDNRLGIDVAWYKKNAFNQILELATTNESGVSSKLVNAGNIQNQGWEILLTANPIRGRDFNWDMTVNFTRNRNKIIELADGVKNKSLELAFGADVQAYAVAGEDYGTVITGYGYGIYHTQDGSASPANGKRVIGNAPNGSADLTFLRSQDYDGSTKTLGNIMERFMLGTTQSVRYKDFTLGLQVDSKFGGLMASATHQYGSNTGAFKNSLFGRDAAHGGVTYTDAGGVSHNDGIIPDGVLNDGIKSISGGVELGGMTFADAVSKGYLRPVSAQNYYNDLSQWSSGIREYSIFENSWVAVRELSIGYNLPARIYKKISMNGLRVSLIGRNLGYLYKSLPDDLNPEGYYTNRAAGFAEYGGLPFSRSLGFSLNATF